MAGGCEFCRVHEHPSPEDDSEHGIAAVHGLCRWHERDGTTNDPSARAVPIRMGLSEEIALVANGQSQHGGSSVGCSRRDCGRTRAALPRVGGAHRIVPREPDRVSVHVPLDRAFVVLLLARLFQGHERLDLDLDAVLCTNFHTATTLESHRLLQELTGSSLLPCWCTVDEHQRADRCGIRRWASAQHLSRSREVAR